MMNRALILLVEDDPEIQSMNREALLLEGYRVALAGTLGEARACVLREEPDLIVLDITLPDGNGLAYCGELRRSGVRVLFLSALSTKADAIAGIRAGGDDYITKPYMIEELLVRVEALMRRGKLIGPEEGPLRLGGLTLHFTSGRVLIGGEDMLLTPKEFTLFETLFRSRNRYVSSEKLCEAVWGMGAADDIRTLKVHISNLRRKLGDGFAIESSRGAGYRLVIHREG